MVWAMALSFGHAGMNRIRKMNTAGTPTASMKNRTAAARRFAATSAFSRSR
jgi:hypothetical protein